MVTAKDIGPSGAEQRLQLLGIQLPEPPTPFGSYVETQQAGKLLFLSGMLPVVDHRPKYVGRIGNELDAEAGRDAARVATLNGFGGGQKASGLTRSDIACRTAWRIHGDPRRFF